MRKVFWDNPYQSHLETHVVSVDNNLVLFEETIAFSFSGGQNRIHEKWLHIQTTGLLR
jgi:hypothetical protein